VRRFLVKQVRAIARTPVGKILLLVIALHLLFGLAAVASVGSG
jgi:hypothetical protein